MLDRLLTRETHATQSVARIRVITIDRVRPSRASLAIQTAARNRAIRVSRPSELKSLATWGAKLRTMLVNVRVMPISGAKKHAMPPTTEARAKTRTIRTKTKIGNRAAHSRAGLLSAFVLSMLPTFALAQTTPQQQFALGRAAFERQDFPAALKSFEAALAAKLQGPAIHHNIGVTAYRLQRYERARRAFEEVAKTPAMAGLAHYNLGLIAKAEGDTVRAREMFERAQREATDDRVRALASLQLGDAPRPPRTLLWGAYVASGLGYEDNVTLSSTDSALGITREGDVYGETQAVGSLSLSSAWRFDGDVSYLNYADLNEYDQLGFGLAARYRFRFHDWTTDAGTQLSTTLVDGDAFEQRQLLYVQGSKWVSEDWRVRARLRLSYVDGASDYPGYDGLRHEASVRVNRSMESWRFGLGYFFELTDYDSARLSAMRHSLIADASHPLTSAWSVRSSLAYRHSDYDSAERGTENRFVLTVGADRSLIGPWTLVVEYAMTDNSASDAFYEYERNRLFAGVEATF